MSQKGRFEVVQISAINRLASIDPNGSRTNFYSSFEEAEAFFERRKNLGFQCLIIQYSTESSEDGRIIKFS